jgi:hypothetical protein
VATERSPRADARGSVCLAIERAQQIAEDYSASCGGAGRAAKDPGHRGGSPHYHGLDAAESGFPGIRGGRVCSC